jgi:hypothetical protein
MALLDLVVPPRPEKSCGTRGRADDYGDKKYPEAQIDDIERQIEHRRVFAPEKADVIERSRQRPGKDAADRDWIACAMFAAVFVIFNYKIFTRYFEHDEAVWADEVLVILFIWIIFWANAFLVRDKEQITFDLVYRLFPAAAQRYIALARAVTAEVLPRSPRPSRRPARPP